MEHCAVSKLNSRTVKPLQNPSTRLGHAYIEHAQHRTRTCTEVADATAHQARPLHPTAQVMSEQCLMPRESCGRRLTEHLRACASSMSVANGSRRHCSRCHSAFTHSESAQRLRQTILPDATRERCPEDASDGHVGAVAVPRLHAPQPQPRGPGGPRTPAARPHVRPHRVPHPKPGLHEPTPLMSGMHSQHSQEASPSPQSGSCQHPVSNVLWPQCSPANTQQQK